MKTRLGNKSSRWSLSRTKTVIIVVCSGLIVISLIQIAIG